MEGFSLPSKAWHQNLYTDAATGFVFWKLNCVINLRTGTTFLFTAGCDFPSCAVTVPKVSQDSFTVTRGGRRQSSSTGVVPLDRSA